MSLLTRLSWVCETLGVRRQSVACLFTDATEYKPGMIRYRRIGRQRRFVAADVLKLCGADERSNQSTDRS